MCDILGVRIDNISPEQAVEKVFDLAGRRPASVVVTPNPEIIQMCRENGELMKAVRSADMRLADGIGVIYASRILGQPIKSRVTGIGLAEGLMKRMASSGGRLFLLGARPGVAEEAAARLSERFPGLEIAGTCDGYFSDSGPVIEKINKSRADVVFVCLGSPKQEIWMHCSRDKVDAGVLIGLGGSLDVFSGRVRRAPPLLQKAGLEWLYRLATDPKRIKRMLKIPKFLFAAVRERVKNSRTGRGT